MVYDFSQGSVKSMKPGKDSEVVDQRDIYKAGRGDSVSLQVVGEKSFEVMT